jgi:hypothetical protein
MRFEKKLILKNDFEVESLRHLLYSCGGTNVFPTRNVKTIYFDFLDKDLNSNLNGDFLREKTRLRWYNDSNDFNLEVKQKKGEVGSKIIRNIGKIEGIEKEALYRFNHADVLKRLKFDNNFSKMVNPRIPVSFNSYIREYFYFPIQDLRVTIDTNCLFYNLRISENVLFTDILAIVEFKYDEKNIVAHYYVKELVNSLNLAFIRCSKFLFSAGIKEYS